MVYFRLKTDVLVVSCDCVTNASIQPLLNDYRKNDAALATFFFNSGSEQGAIVPGPKNLNKSGKESAEIIFNKANFIISLCLFRTGFNMFGSEE